MIALGIQCNVHCMLTAAHSVANTVKFADVSEGEEDECSRDEPCSENQTCLAAGAFGRRRCVDCESLITRFSNCYYNPSTEIFS